MKKKVIVACGGAVATSTVAANAVVDLAKENGIDVEIARGILCHLAYCLQTLGIAISKRH